MGVHNSLATSWTLHTHSPPEARRESPENPESRVNGFFTQYHKDEARASHQAHLPPSPSGQAVELLGHEPKFSAHLSQRFGVQVWGGSAGDTPSSKEGSEERAGMISQSRALDRKVVS